MVKGSYSDRTIGKSSEDCEMRWHNNSVQYL